MVNRRKKILETPKRRQRRRRRAIIKLVVLFIFLFVILGISIWFFQTKYLQVSEVQVFGTNEINPELIKAKTAEISSGNIFFILPKNQILLYPRKQIESVLRNDFKEASNVSVKLVGINKIAINIQERSPFARYCIDSCFFIDESGFVYKDATLDSMATSSVDNLITFHDVRFDSASSSSPIGTYPLDGGKFKSLENFARNISSLNLGIKEVVIGLNNDVSILTNEGKVIVSITNPLDQQFDLLKIALSQIKKFDYIDVRFGNKIFYKIGNSTSATSSVNH